MAETQHNQDVSANDIKHIPVSDLVPYENNARTHSEEQIVQVTRSIQEFGFTNPVLVKGLNIIAGHCRVMAASRLGMDAVPTIDLSYLTEDQARAYIIADNQLALNAEWELGVLTMELESLRDAKFDLSLLGFTEMELREHLGDVPFLPSSEEDQRRLDEKAPTTCPECGHEFVAGQWI